MINEYLKIKEIGVLDEPLKLCYYSFRNLTIAQNKYYEYKKHSVWLLNEFIRVLLL